MEWDMTGTLAIQTREEGLRIANDLSRLTLPKDRNVEYTKIAGLKNYDVKEYVLKDEESFIALY